MTNLIIEIKAPTTRFIFAKNMEEFNEWNNTKEYEDSEPYDVVTVYKDAKSFLDVYPHVDGGTLRYYNVQTKENYILEESDVKDFLPSCSKFFVYLESCGYTDDSTEFETLQEAIEHAEHLLNYIQENNDYDVADDWGVNVDDHNGETVYYYSLVDELVKNIEPVTKKENKMNLNQMQKQMMEWEGESQDFLGFAEQMKPYFSVLVDFDYDIFVKGFHDEVASLQEEFEDLDNEEYFEKLTAIESNYCKQITDLFFPIEDFEVTDCLEEHLHEEICCGDLSHLNINYILNYSEKHLRLSISETEASNILEYLITNQWENQNDFECPTRDELTAKQREWVVGAAISENENDRIEAAHGILEIYFPNYLVFVDYFKGENVELEKIFDETMDTLF